MARHPVIAPVSAIVLAAFVAVAAGFPAAAAEQMPAAGAVSPALPATPSVAVPALPDLTVTMAPMKLPYQRPDGTNCIDFRPGTVVVSNIGKLKATNFGVGIYWNYGGGEFGIHSPIDGKELEPGKSMTLVMDQPIYAFPWCPGSYLPTWRAVADYGFTVRESDERNNIAEKTLQPALPRQPRPKARQQGSTP